MYDFKILTAGEKIRKIRDDFGFTQEDITGGDVTRNLVSILENNKTGLTQKVAKVLADGINNLCRQRNIDFSITPEYLLEDVICQAKKIASDYIEYINTLPQNEIINITDKLNEIDVFLKSYNTQEKKSILYRGMATINVINPIKTLFTNLQLKIVSQKSYFWDTIFYDIKV